MCERQRDRETERQIDRETERQRDRETERQRDRETERKRQRHKEREMEGKRNRQREYIGLVKYIFQLQLVRLVILSSHLHLFKITQKFCIRYLSFGE